MITRKHKFISLALAFVMVMIMITSVIPPVQVSAATTPTVFLQEGEEWSDHPYGHKDGTQHTSSSSCNNSSDTDIGYSGCGVLAYVNAIYYLNGNFIDPIKLADYAISNGHRVCTVGTAASLYSGFAGAYGTTYGFEYGKYHDTDFTTMQSHLTDGGVVVANVPGHFIAIVDYDSDSQKYLVLDSYPTTTRGTTASGDWKTKSELSSGKLSVNYFMTFTSTEENVVKTNPTTTFDTNAETYTLGDTYELTGSVTGSEADLKAVQVSLYGPDTKTSGIVLYRWEGTSANVSLDGIVEFQWGDVVYRDSSLTSGTESLDTNMPGTYWIQVYATDVNGNGFASEKCKTITVKNESSAVTNWNEEYNPNYNDKITPELIQEFLESYSSGGLYQTNTSNGQTILSIDGTDYDLEFDSYYLHSNTITDSNPLSELSTAQNLTPAEIIYYACVENDMNVVWMLANLQKEQSLIGSVGSDYQTRLNRAVGYMKFTEGTRSHYEDGEKFYGFVGQTIAATYQFWSYATTGKTAEQAYETYTPSSESGNMTYADFMSDIYDVYAAWFDENMSGSGTETPTYLDTPVITSPSAADTYAAGDSITFSWNAVEGADYYVIGVKDLTNGITLTAETLGTASDEDNQIEDTFCTLDGAYVLSGHELKFAVGACSNDGLLSEDWSSVTTVIEATVLPDVTYYTITYDANGGTDAPAVDTKLEDVGINLNGVGPAREGYTCIGWATDPDATEAEYALGEVYDDNADITLYAVWQADTVVEPDEPETDTDYGTVVDSGTCGDNLTWVMYDSGVLVISGEGEMTVCETTAYPWYTYKEQVLSVIFEKGITTIASDAFYNYELIQEVTFSEGLITIGARAFEECNSIKELNIPDTVTTIDEDAFYSCDLLKSVYLGKSLNTTGWRVFYHCSNLAVITIPDELTSVGNHTFSDTSISTIIVFDSVTSIPSEIYNLSTIVAFEVTDEDGNGYYDVDGVLYHYNDYTEVKELIKYPSAKALKGTYTIEDGTNIINDSAFASQTQLTAIVMPESVHTLEGSAFSGCTGLVEITIGDAITSVGYKTFNNTNIYKVIVRDSVTTIPDGIYGLSTITKFEVTDEDGNGYYDVDGVLYHYNDYTEVKELIKYPSAKALKGTYTIEDGTNIINAGAFSSQTQLTAIIMPTSLYTVESDVFNGCTGLVELTIGDAITSVGYHAFNNTSIYKVIVRDSVTTIPDGIYGLSTITKFEVTDEDENGYYDVDGVLYHYNDYTEVKELIKYPSAKALKGTYTIEDGTDIINAGAFSGQTQLTSIVMPTSLYTVESDAFNGCTGLVELTIGDAITSIGYHAFHNTSIYKVIVRDSVTTIPDGIYGLSTITKFEVTDEDGNGYYDVDGVLYHYNDYTEVKELIKYPRAKVLNGTYIIEDGTNIINASAFTQMTELEIVILPSSIYTIESDAFYGCTKLAGAYFYGDTPSSIGYHAFYNISADFVMYYIEGNETWTTPTWNGYTTATFVPEDTTVSVTGVTLNESTAIMTVGSTLTLTATVAPADATDPSVTWTSSNTAVAKVSDGKVTAVSAGTAVITVTTTDGGYTASCTVTVEAAEVEIPEDAPVVTVANVTGRAGNTVDVTISIENNTGITGAIFRVNYDSALTLTNVVAGDAFTSLTMADLAVPYLNPLVLSWDGDGNDTSNGTLVTLTFTIPEGMETGDYPIVIAYDTDDIYDSDLNDVAIAVVNGQITVTDIVYGDYNNDGKINGKDLTLIRRYISGGFDLSGYDAAAADVNLDGKVNGKDLTLIRRYISGGFDIVLGQ